MLFKKHFLSVGKIDKDKRKERSYVLVFQNAAIFWFFYYLGLSIGKKKRVKIPKWIKENDKFFLNYIAGLSDTDGSIRGRRIQLKQKCRELLVELRNKLIQMGISCNPVKVNYTNEKPYYYIIFDRNQILLRKALVAQR